MLKKNKKLKFKLSYKVTVIINTDPFLNILKIKLLHVQTNNFKIYLKTKLSMLNLMFRALKS